MTVLCQLGKFKTKQHIHCRVREWPVQENQKVRDQLKGTLGYAVPGQPELDRTTQKHPASQTQPSYNWSAEGEGVR